MTQIHGIVWPGTLLLPRLSYAYRSIQAVVSGRRQWRPFPSTLRFHLLFLLFFFFFSTLHSSRFLDSFHILHILRGPTWSSNPTPFYTSIPRTVPSHDTPLDWNGSFRDTTRDSRLSTSLMRECQLTSDTNPPLPLHLFNPLFPRVPHRLFTRSRPGKPSRRVYDDAQLQQVDALDEG